MRKLVRSESPETHEERRQARARPAASNKSGFEGAFTAVYEQVSESEGGGFMGYVEEVPGALTQGETLEETRENLKEALQLVLEANRELFGVPVPPRRVIREKIAVRTA
jgi:predicted RNase H-like HicB family nuclease